MGELLIVLVCLILNAVFAAYEMAFVAVSKPQLRTMAIGGNKRALLLLRFRERPERTLSIIQIGITTVGLISAAVGGVGAHESFAPYLQSAFGYGETTSEVIAIGAIVIPLTFLNLVIGELVPKAFALKNSMRIAMFGANAIGVAYRILAPFVHWLERVTALILRLLPGSNRPGEIVRESNAVELSELSHSTQQYVFNLVNVERKRVRDVMIDWADATYVSIVDSREHVAATALASGHTRLPVVDNGKVVGVLHTKEFIALLATDQAGWQTLVRPVLLADENDHALATFRLMQQRRSNLCIVVASNGAPLGLVTLEDVIEEIVGDIYDEDDDGRMKRLLAEQTRRRLRGKK